MKGFRDILGQRRFSKGDIVRLLQPGNPGDEAALFARAGEVTRSFFGDGVFLRGIIEFSNYCRRDCRYCGIRRSGSAVERYRMSPEEILGTVVKIREAGIGTVVLQSGEDPQNRPEYIEKIIRMIRGKVDIAVTLSLGEYGAGVYRRWRRAGAQRYLLKFETSDKRLYRELHPDCSYRRRWQCLKYIRDAGFQLGSGFMTGLPGQSAEMIAEDLLALHSLEPDMAGIGPFISHPGTPMRDARNGSPALALHVLAVARLLLRDTHLPTTTALETLENDSRIGGLNAGANVIMPNFTPERYKRLYEIYPDKAGSTGTPEDSMQTIVRQIAQAGKYVEKGYGHSIKKNRNIR